MSHSYFSRIFIKVYIVLASLKRHKKTSHVNLFSFSQEHWSENKKDTFLSNLHNCQFILRTTVNFIYSNMKWFFRQRLLAVQQFYIVLLILILASDSNYFLKASSFIYFSMVPKLRITFPCLLHQKLVFHSPL